MKPRFAIAALPLAVFVMTSTASATDRVRNTTATSLNDVAAWTGGVVPTSSDRAVWNGTSSGGAQTLGDNASWNGILISSGTPSSLLFTNAANPSPFTLTLNGDGIDLNAGSATNRGITFESNTAIALGANQTWKLGDGETSANIIVSSVVSGAFSLEVTRTSGASNYAQLGGLNTFSGGFTAGANAWVRVASSSVTSGTTVTSGALGTAQITLNDGALLSSASGTGYVIAVPQINVAGNITLAQSTGGTGRLQIAGTWDLGGATRIVTLGKASTGSGAPYASGLEVFNFNRPTTGGNFTVPAVQNGTLSLASTTGTVATPSVARIGSGGTTSFINNAGLSLGDGVALTSGTGTFFGTGTNAPALTLAAPVSNGGGILQMGDGTNAGNAVMRSAEVYSLSDGGTVSSSNSSGTATTGTLTINNGNGAVFSGTISQGGTGIIAITKSGTGSQTLSGANSYTGKTTISGGTLQFGKQVSLYNNNPASWTDTNIQVDNGATLALNVGGTGEFTSSDVAALTALGTGSGGFKLSSKLGLDTTNASGGSFTYSNVIANPNAGANTLSLRKLGTGTLVLDQANTFTGGTTVESGTLKVTQPAALSTSGTVTVNSGAALDTDFSGLGAAGTINRTITGTGTINATPANTFQVSFSSGILTTFSGTVNVKPSPASNGRVDLNGALGSGAIVNIESGATGRFALTGTYSGLTVNVAGVGGSGPGALRLQDTTLDSSCVVNLTANASIGSFTPAVSTIATAIVESGGARSLTKSGSSTLNLTAQNTYTGDTIITGGTLRLGNGTTNTGLANAADVNIAAAATLELNYTGTDTIDELTINGVQKAAGIWGSATSGAPNTDPQLTGTGTLTVTTGPVVSNTPPTISDIANLSVPSGGSTGALAFTVGDAETAAGSLIVTGSSSNTTLVPNGNIVIGGSGASRTVTVTPVSGLSGTATITVTVDDGSLTANDTFTLTVTDNYLSWSTANSVTGGANGDSDNDGVKNLVEYALVNGGERGVLSGNTITFTKRGAPYGSDLTYGIVTSTDLVNWSTPGSGVTENATSISYTFTPGSPAKNFARLKVVQAP